MTTFTGFGTAATSVRMVGRSRMPGAYSTSAPAAAKACSRRDRTVEIRAAMEKILRPGDHGEGKGQLARFLDGRCDALHGERKVVDRFCRVSGCVLKRAADGARFRREPHD